jgi:hypothetical protein
MPLTYQEACDLVKVLQKIKPLRTEVIPAWSYARKGRPDLLRDELADIRASIARQRKLLDAADRALDQAEGRL